MIRRLVLDTVAMVLLLLVIIMVTLGVMWEFAKNSRKMIKL